MLGIKIVPQNNVGLVETFGKYSRTVNAGINFYIPLAQHIANVSMAMEPISLPGYSIITKDNAEIVATVTLNYHVTNAVKYQYENTDSVESMAQLVRGHLRDIMGNLDLNEALVSTKKINVDLAEAIGDLTDTYGIKVDRINIDELKPSLEIQKAMDKQLTADRNKTAAILRAEGESKSIELTTKAKNDALVNTAKAEATAKRTAADAEKYRIDVVQEALNNVSETYLANQSIDAYRQLANSDTNLVVVPNDGSSTYGQAGVLGNLINPKKPTFNKHNNGETSDAVNDISVSMDELTSQDDE